MWHLDEGTIHAWLDGALSPDEARRVEAHVGSCTVCADAVAEARGLIAASSRILTALDDVPYVKGARSTEGAKGERRSLTAWLVRERIAAVVAMVVAGGALALVVSRDATAPTSIQTMSEPTTAFELTVADSPAPPPAPASEVRARETDRTTRLELPRVASPTPARDLATVDRADSAPAADRDLGAVTGAVTELARSQVRTDDTARQVVVAQEAFRETAQAASAGKSSVAEKLANALPGRRAEAEVDASARLAQPPASEVRLRGLASIAGARDTRLLQDERMMESGREVHRRIYRVDDILVTLDERAPDSTGAGERRAGRLDPNALAAAPAPMKDSATASTNTIRWTDARGTEFVLTGPASPARLAEIRKLLGY